MFNGKSLIFCMVNSLKKRIVEMIKVLEICSKEKFARHGSHIGEVYASSGQRLAPTL
jgi:hypothetical protein